MYKPVLNQDAVEEKGKAKRPDLKALTKASHSFYHVYYKKKKG